MLNGNELIAIMGPDAYLMPIAVADIDDPSAELNAIAGSFNGQMVLIYQVDAAHDEYTIYAWDSASSTSELVPYTVDGAGGASDLWIAISGKYQNGDRNIGGWASGSITWGETAANTMTVAGATTWDMGAVTTLDFDGGVAIKTVANANQLYLAAGGQNIMGHNASVTYGGTDARLQVLGTTTNTSTLSIGNFQPGALVPQIKFIKSKNATIGSSSTVADNDQLMNISAYGSDDSNLNTQGASIIARVDGTPFAGGNRMPTEFEFWTALGGTDDDLAISAKIQKDAMLNLYGGTISILAGADEDAKARTNSTAKQMLFGMPLYNTGDTPAIASLIYGATDNGTNVVNIGGGDASMNAATSIVFWTAANASTPTGTIALTLANNASATFGGDVLMPGKLGLTGTRVLEGWFTDLEVTNDITIGGSALATIYQPLHASLTSIAGLTETNGGLLYGTADNTYAWLAAGTAGYVLQANGVGAPTWLDIVNTYQPLDANLTSIAGLSHAVGDLIYTTAATTYAALADVAVGSVLVSGGVGVAPAWSATLSLTDLSLSNDLLMALNSIISFNAADFMTHSNHVMTLTGFTSWNFGTADVILSATKKLYLDEGVNTYLYEKSADNLVMVLGGVAEHVNTVETLVDDESYVHTTKVAGFGTVMIGDNQEWATFRFSADGTVTLIANSANVDNADTDGDLCIYDVGSGIAVKNRLGLELRAYIQISSYVKEI